MSIETESFKKLLPIKEMYELYQCLDGSIKNEIDLINSRFDTESSLNSISIFIDIGYINISIMNKYKKNNEYSYEEFKEHLIDGLLDTYKETMRDVFNINFYYDDSNDRFYFYRNHINLKYSGLIMVLEDLKYIVSYDGIKFHFSNNIETSLEYCENRNKISIEDLKNKLEIEERLGKEAEAKAEIFENQNLLIVGINKKCKIISNIDVAAGYDIVSYINNNDNYDKFIEVKSCDDTLAFHMSSNEIQKSKDKGEAYFLYLYNRTKDTFVIIKNPYNEIFVQHNWNYEPTSFLIEKI